jgi:hypothetical protein
LAHADAAPGALDAGVADYNSVPWRAQPCACLLCARRASRAPPARAFSYVCGLQNDSPLDLICVGRYCHKLDGARVRFLRCCTLWRLRPAYAYAARPPGSASVAPCLVKRGRKELPTPKELRAEPDFFCERCGAWKERWDAASFSVRSGTAPLRRFVPALTATVQDRMAMARQDKAERERDTAAAAGVAPVTGPGRKAAAGGSAGGRSTKAVAGGVSPVDTGVVMCRKAVAAVDEISFKLIFSSPAAELVYTVDRSNSSAQSLAVALATFAYSNIGDQAGVRALECFSAYRKRRLLTRARRAAAARTGERRYQSNRRCVRCSS